MLTLSLEMKKKNLY